MTVHSVRIWINENSWAVIPTIAAGLFAVIWWASKIDDRVFLLETREPPYVELLSNRLTTVETNQIIVLKRLDTIEEKIDKLSAK